MNEEKKALIPSVSYALETLFRYKREKSELESRMKEEQSTWRSIYDGVGSSSWIFNSIVNKHADIIDNIPTCTCLPREKRDEAYADTLCKIIPVITQRCAFEETYSDNAWEKLKHGTAVWGVFWNNSLEDGLGDIDIKRISLSDIFWDMSVNDLQDSKNVFITSMEDIDALEARYEHFSYADEKDRDSLSSAFLGYGESDGKCTVVDWYYKRHLAGGKSILHYCKIAGGCILYSSENDPYTAESGWYEHGLYPFVFDKMYPRESGICGFGLIAIGSSVQNYINRLDSNVLNYTDWASRVRFWAKRSIGVNEKDFLDLDKSIVEVEGDIDEEKLRQIEIEPIDDSIIDIKRLKIDELKEITGSRDVSQGGVSGGVTAASAISILREAGAKSSRDGIEETYRAYIRIISLMIELIRQFYDEKRVFRIVGDGGEIEYLGLSGKELRDGDDGHRPFFDIEISAMKKTPGEAEKRNTFAKALYDAGAFKKENVKETLLMLDLMDFEGIGKLRASLRRSDGE